MDANGTTADRSAAQPAAPGEGANAPIDNLLGALMGSQGQGPQGALPGGELAEESCRNKALERFKSVGLPHRRIEAWKYTDLHARLRQIPPLAPLAGQSSMRREQDLAKGNNFSALNPMQIVLIDGVYDPDRSDVKALNDAGIDLRPAEERAAPSSADEQKENGAASLNAGDPLADLNAAFWQGGLHIDIAQGVRLDRPIEIRHILAEGNSASLMPRNHVMLGKGAQAVIIDQIIGGSDGDFFNSVSQWRLAEQSQLTLVRINDARADMSVVNSHHFHLDAKAQLRQLILALGPQFSREQSFVHFAAMHASADLHGISLVSERQHVDQTVLVDHAIGHGRSNEEFRTVATGRARAVFQGKICVHPQAQKTDGKMMSRALMLSEDAAIYNKPELEIFADDVQCGHGATTGRIDETMLFYMRARGIDEATARRLLIIGFLREVCEFLEDPALIEALDVQIRDQLEMNAF